MIFFLFSSLLLNFPRVSWWRREIMVLRYASWNLFSSLLARATVLLDCGKWWKITSYCVVLIRLSIFILLFWCGSLREYYSLSNLAEVERCIKIMLVLLRGGIVEMLRDGSDAKGRESDMQHSINCFAV